MEVLESAEEKRKEFKELMAKKRKLLTKIKRTKKALVKARIEKRKINEELKKLGPLAGLSVDDAKSKVAAEIEAVQPGQIYPQDLERQFDRIDRPKNRTNDRDVLDLEPEELESISAGSSFDVEDVDDEIAGKRTVNSRNQPVLDQDVEDDDNDGILDAEDDEEEEVIDLSE